MKQKRIFKYALLIFAIAVTLVGCWQKPADTPNDPVEMPTDTTLPIEEETTTPPVENISPLPMSEDDAKIIALNEAKVQESDVTDLSIELKTENNLQYYKVTFNVGETKYDYEIDAGTGEILKEEEK
ncbi:MAG: hypothetical protein GX666_04615 [Tissierellia bacterium]|nr:hypothetical protein [Tissierellia bacterium]